MKVKIGQKTKRILLERDIYSNFVNEISKIKNFNGNSIESIDTVEKILKKYDPKLFDEYEIMYLSPGKNYDLKFVLKRKITP
ncbi:MAG: hypothetical protein QXD43_00250 [Candidatus Aenigmatarchaeota archaeon]